MKAVFYTQAGGTAVQQGDSYVWEEPPEWMKDAEPGDLIPDEWDITGPFDSETNERLYEESDLFIDDDGVAYPYTA